jgi:hypothetical protein
MISDKRKHFRQHFRDLRCSAQLFVVNTCQGGDVLIQLPVRINESLPLPDDPVILHLHGADLDDPIPLRFQTRSLQVDAHI